MTAEGSRDGLDALAVCRLNFNVPAVQCGAAVGEDAEVEAFFPGELAGVGQKAHDQAFGIADLGVGVGPHLFGDGRIDVGDVAFVAMVERAR